MTTQILGFMRAHSLWGTQVRVNFVSVALIRAVNLHKVPNLNYTFGCPPNAQHESLVARFFFHKYLLSFLWGIIVNLIVCTHTIQALLFKFCFSFWFFSIGLPHCCHVMRCMGARFFVSCRVTDNSHVTCRRAHHTSHSAATIADNNNNRRRFLITILQEGFGIAFTFIQLGFGHSHSTAAGCQVKFGWWFVVVGYFIFKLSRYYCLL